MMEEDPTLWSDEKLVVWIVNDQLAWLEINYRYQNHPLWVPAPTEHGKTLMNKAWQEALDRNLHTHINGQVKAKWEEKKTKLETLWKYT